jgi:hypothetical protein
VYEREIEGDK